MFSTLMGLMAETPVHMGAGAALEVIDLPIQRETPTDFPCAFASSVKGALRAHATDKKMEDIKTVFGPDRQNASEYAGALSITDARLLLLPVRSLTSRFRRATCPFVIQRLVRDLRRHGQYELAQGLDALSQNTLTKLDDENALVVKAAGNGPLYLEEYPFVQKVDPLQALVTTVRQLAARSLGADYDGADLVVVSDDVFTHFCRTAVPVEPHIAIDSQTRTVMQGALWYEENLPPETLLYCGLAASAGRSGKSPDAAQGLERVADKLDARQVLERVTGLLEKHPYLQMGAGLTTGQGWCATSVLKPAEA